MRGHHGGWQARSSAGHQYAIRNVGESSGLLPRRSYTRVVLMLACPSHSCTFAMSALCSSAQVSAVVRKACGPMFSPVRPNCFM